ncbi:Peptide chain release factor 1 [Listeria monocytogenes N53-1]|nr:Peptide chain release factor 1 [Listeria monocytogenes N53-1]
MYDRLQAVEDRYDELNELLSDPDVVSDPKRLRDLSKEQSRQSKRTANTKM